jgi:stage V sporulation protein AB
MAIIGSRLLCIIWGLASGAVLSGGITAFLNMIGIIPALSHKAQIQKHPYALGTALTLGAVFGMICVIWDIYLPLPGFFRGVMGFCTGIFVGCLAAALTEALDVIPIMSRRIHLRKGLTIFMYAFALGKLIGALYYWLYPGFIIH